MAKGDVEIKLLAVDQTANAVRAAKKSVDDLKKAILEAEKAVASGDKAAKDSITQLRLGLKEASAALRSAKEQAKQAGDAFRRAAKEAEDAFKRSAEQAAQFRARLQDVSSTAMQVGAVAAAGFAALGLAVRKAVSDSNEMKAAFLGLESVARGTGQDLDETTAAARKLASDGLMSVSDAATGLKNLLAAGFGLDQAVTLMNAFRDSAAFGRQAALGFGEAIRGATEGVKNGRSELVDNAGVTKNLSNMLVDAGFAATDLNKAANDAGVRQAIFNGILKETSLQAGNAAKLANELAGDQAALAATTKEASAAVGSALEPTLRAVLAPLKDAAASVKAWAEENPRLVASNVTLAASMLATTTAAGLLASGIARIALLLSSTAGPIALAVTALGVLAGALVSNKIQAEAAKRETETLADRYTDLKRVLENTATPAAEQKRAQEELAKVVGRLAELVPDLVTAYDAEGKALDVLTGKIIAQRQEREKLETITTKNALFQRQQFLRQQTIEEEQQLAALNAGKTPDEANIFSGVDPLTGLRLPSTLTAEEAKSQLATTLRANQAELRRVESRLFAMLAGEGAAAGMPEIGGGVPLPPGDFGPMEQFGLQQPSLTDDLGERISSIQKRFRAGRIDAAQAVEELRRAEESLAKTQDDRLDIDLAIQTIEQQTAKAADKNLSAQISNVQQLLSLGYITQQQAKERLKGLEAQAGGAQDLLDIHMAQRGVEEQIRRGREKEFGTRLTGAARDILNPEDRMKALDAIAVEFADVLKDPELARSLQQAMQGATRDIFAAPFRKGMAEIKALGDRGELTPDKELEMLRRIQPFASLSDADANKGVENLNRTIGRIKELEAARAARGFAERFQGVQARSDTALAAAQPQMGDLQRQLITEQARGDLANPATIAKLELDAKNLIRPILEAKADGFRELAKTAVEGSEEQKRALEAAAQVDRQLQDDSLDVFRIVTDAKVKLVEAAQKRMSEAENARYKQAQIKETNRHKTEMDNIRDKMRAKIDAQDEVLRGLDEERRALDRQFQAEDTADQRRETEDRLARARASLAEFERSGPRVRDVLTGQFTLDPVELQRFQDEVAEAEKALAGITRDEQRDQQRGELDDRIRTEREKLDALRTSLQDQLSAEQTTHQRITDSLQTEHTKQLDAIKTYFEDVKAAEDEQLPAQEARWKASQDTILANTATWAAAMKKQADAVSAAFAAAASAMTGVGVPRPSFSAPDLQGAAPRSVAASAGGSSVTIGSVQLSLPSVREPEDFLPALARALAPYARST